MVVGAPFDGPNKHGAVYVYYGTRDGIENNYRQVRILTSLAATLISDSFLEIPIALGGSAETGLHPASSLARTKQSKAKQKKDKTKQNKTKQDKTKQNKSNNNNILIYCVDIPLVMYT